MATPATSSTSSDPPPHDERPSTAEASCLECKAEFHYRIHWMTMDGRSYRMPPLAPELCPNCRGKAEFAETRAQLEERRRQIGRLLPKEFADANLLDLDGPLVQRPELRDFLRRWKGRTWLYIYGGVGTGKSYTMAATVRWALEAATFRDAAWVNVPDFLGDLYDSIGQQGQRRQYDLGHLKTVHLLAIDELGVGNTSQFVKGRVYELLHARWERQLPTIITSEFNLDAVGGQLGQRIASRIVQRSQQIHLEGDDLRKQLGDAEVSR